MSAAPALLSLEEIHTYYGNSHILQGVSLEVRAGEVVALLGRNGVGKTTTVQSILGLPAPRRGRVLLRDRDVAGQSPHAIVRAGVGWVPQGHRIFPTLSVDENLRLAARNRRPGRWDVDGVYGLFPRLRERSTARGGSLSGGEQQMLAIGRTLVQNPDVILMDEPSEGLSPRIVDEVGRIIAMLPEVIQHAAELAPQLLARVGDGGFKIRGGMTGLQDLQKMLKISDQGVLEVGDELGTGTDRPLKSFQTLPGDTARFQGLVK